MKKVSLEQMPPEVAELFESAHCGRVLVTRNGQPFAVISSAGNKDEEDLELEESPEFWRMIREQRRETDTVALEEFMEELDAEEKQGENQEAEPASNQPPQAP